MGCVVLTRYRVKNGKVAQALDVLKFVERHTMEAGATSVRHFRTSLGGPNTNDWTGLIEFGSYEDMARWAESAGGSPTLEMMQQLYPSDSAFEYLHAELINEVDLAGL